MAHEVSLGSSTLTIGKFGAQEGWKLLHKLMKIAGPAIAAFSEKEFGQGVSAIFKEVDADELWKLINQLTSVCLIDGKKITVIELADYTQTIEIVGEVIKHNFGDFFSPLLENLKDFGQTTTEQS
jgi:hypothetical protein